MKKIIIATFLFCSAAMFGQYGNYSGDLSDMNLPSKRMFLKDHPVQALQILKQEAGNGKAKAMNIIGIIYSKGMADTVDYKLAREWFEKSAENGYPNAWMNLALLYKDGLGVKQDFTRAYQYFSKGAELNVPNCIYSLGYLHYKGLGCEQNYSKAVQLFRKDIDNGSLGAMYMLGICFRNGYGITQNTDSARFWLARASEAGFSAATDELQAKDPENNITTTTGTSKKQQVHSTAKHNRSGYQKISHNTNYQRIEGEYAGYAILYDWSGQHVIGKSTLRLSLTCRGSEITGIWTENDSTKATISASLQDTALVFNNTEYKKSDHYHHQTLNQLDFRSARLQLVQLNDSVYMAGNVQLYSVTSGEPEKPMYIILSKIPEQSKVAAKSLISEKSGTAAIPNQGMHVEENLGLLAYPNPFKNSCQVSFDMPTGGKAIIRVTDMSGRVLYSLSGQYPKGNTTLSIQTPLPAGSYLLLLSTDTHTEKTIIIKQ